MSGKYNVKTLRPCVGGGLAIEAHFEKGFSMEALCRLLEGIAQCSEKARRCTILPRGVHVHAV